MPRQRTPLEKARVTGRVNGNPARFVGRSEPQSTPLGEASEFLDDSAREAWALFRREFPWLMEADRTLVEIASALRGRFMEEGMIGVQALNALRICISAMGGTPADRSKVSVPDGEDEDPDEKYYN